MYKPGARVRQLSRRAVSLLLFAVVLVHVRPISTFASQSNSRHFFSARDQSLLEDLERRSFRYFWEQAGASTGLVLDRTRTDGAPADEDHRAVASIAATGFGLTGICIASERGWVPRAGARGR